MMLMLVDGRTDGRTAMTATVFEFEAAAEEEVRTVRCSRRGDDVDIVIQIILWVR